MNGLAFRMLRHRPGSVLATLIALAVGAMILTALGVLVESGLRYTPVAQRFAAADVVVAHRTMTVTGKDIDGSAIRTTVELPEGTVPADLADRIRQVPGVASAVADHAVPVAIEGAAGAAGHGWTSAALTGQRLTDGRAPAAADELVAADGLGLRTGQPVTLLVQGEPQRFRVSGVSAGGPAGTVWLTDARAADLAPYRDRVDAVGITLAPGGERDAAIAAIRGLASGAGVQTYAGKQLGAAEPSADRDAAGLLVEIGSVMGAYIVLLIVFVVAGTVGLSVRHRRRDLALLRAVAATPRQVRRLVMAEAALVGAAASLAGVPLGLLAAHWTRGELADRGFVPESFPMVPGALSAAAATLLTMLVAVAAARLAARRIAKIRPVEALGEAAAEPERAGRVRLGFGIVTLTGGAAAGVFTAAAKGQAALAAAVGMLYLFVAAVALLAPWINRRAARVLAPALTRLWGPSGELAVANLRANAQGMATVLTALVLSVGFGGSVWFLQDNLERATLTQARDGLRAQQVLLAPAGLPATAADEIRKLPGVVAATPVRHSSVIVRIFGGEAETVPVQAVDPGGLSDTLDLGVRDGDLAGLDKDAMAVDRLRAESQGWKVGDRVPLWLGDGSPVTLRVAAIYDRGLGFGDITLHRQAVPDVADDQVLIRTAAGAAPAVRYPGTTVIGAADLNRQLGFDLALSAWLNKLLVGVMVGYAALAAANTMVMAALARRRELALLRIVGVTRRQARRMVNAEQAGLLGVALTIGAAVAAATLTTVVGAATGNYLPYVPPLGGVVVLGGTALLALTTTILPIGRLLRVPPIEDLGIKE